MIRFLLVALLAFVNVTPAPAKAQTTILFVYIGDSACGFCKKPALKERISAVRDTARRWAAEKHFAFKSVGVAVDVDKALGDEFLAESGVGPHDETVSGKGQAGADPYTKPYAKTDQFFSQGIPFDALPQVVLLVDPGGGRSPRQAFRALGNMIAQDYSAEKMVRLSLDKATE